jgi:hypothetical protein
MKVKTRYRPQQFKDGGAVLPEEIVTPDISLAVTPEVATTDVLDSRPGDDLASGDDATRVFQEQIDALRKSEDLVRQRQASPSQQQPLGNRAARLQQWKQQGLTEDQAAFLQANPKMIDNPHITAMATAQADQEGFGPNSPEHFEVVRKHFNQISEQVERDLMTTSQQRAAPVEEPMPEYSMPRQPSSPSVGYSAPVTRDVPTGTYHGERRLSRVTLSAQEKEIARLSGLTLEQYAEGKLDLMRRKEAGEIG